MDGYTLKFGDARDPLKCESRSVTTLGCPSQLKSVICFTLKVEYRVNQVILGALMFEFYRKYHHEISNLEQRSGATPDIFWNLLPILLVT